MRSTCEALLRARQTVEIRGHARSMDLDLDPAGSTLLVASTGGHLAQLHRLRPRLDGVPERAVWVMFDTPQSRSLLAGERVHYVPLVEPRDLKTVLRNMRFARRLFKQHDVRAVVSTGSGVALSFLPLARASGIPTLYIDSAARSAGPSVTGRLLSLVPGLRLLCQYPAWAGKRWGYSGSVFDEFEPEPAEPAPQVRKVVVTLGTIGYPFDRLVRRLSRSCLRTSRCSGSSATRGVAPPPAR